MPTQRGVELLVAVFIFYGCCNKYHKLSGLKQHKFIFLQFCSSDINIGFVGLKIKLSAWWHFFPEVLWENPFPCLFQLFRSGLHSWACVLGTFPPSSKAVTSGQFSLCCHLYGSLSCCPLSLLRTLVIILGPPYFEISSLAALIPPITLISLTCRLNYNFWVQICWVGEGFCLPTTVVT